MTNQSYATPGTYTWTAPSDITGDVSWAGQGGGGGGDGGTTLGRGGGGGREGDYSEGTFTPVAGRAYTVVIGSGGSGGAYNTGTAAGDGGAVTITDTVTSSVVALIAGGAGGSGGIGGSTAVGGTTTGSYIVSGASGGTSATGTGTAGGNGGAGNSPISGTAGAGGTSGVAATAGTAPGAGGGGGLGNGSTGGLGVGAAGAAAFLSLTYTQTGGGSTTPPTAGAGGVTGHQSFDTGPQQYFCAATFAISPKGAGQVEREHHPASLTGAKVLVYATSSGCRVPPGSLLGGSSTGDDHYGSMVPWPNRFAYALGGTIQNLSIAGSNAEDICCYAYGTHSNATFSTNANPSTTNQAGTFTAQTAPDIVLLDMMGNDLILELSPSSQVRDGTSLAMEALIRLCRSNTVLAHNDGSIAYAGTWTTVTSDGYSGGAAHQTTVPGSTATITTTETGVDLVLIAQDDTKAGATGATYSVTVGGSTVATGTVSNRMKTTGGGGTTPDYGFTQMTIPLDNLGAGTKTIVLTHTGSSGQILRFNAYLTRKTTPPWIVSSQFPPWPADAYSPSGAGAYFTTTQYAAYEQLNRDVVAKFTDGRVIVFDPKDYGLFKNDPTWFLGDYVHPRDPGQAATSKALLRTLSERVA